MTANPSDSVGLLPCPFCGGEAQRITLTEDDGPDNAGGDVVTCTRCGASSHVEFGRKENLVSRWNTRTDAQRDLVEALEDIAHQAESRITDGDEMGARCWRIALVDILAEARATLARVRGESHG